MSIIIRDNHLEEQIDTIRVRRGDATMAKTLSDIAREYIASGAAAGNSPRIVDSHPSPAPSSDARAGNVAGAS